VLIEGVWTTANHQHMSVEPPAEEGTPLQLADGTPAAVGVRVLAVGASGSGNYAAGHTGVICSLNQHDPVVRWDHSGAEHQSSRSKMIRQDGTSPKMRLFHGTDGTNAASIIQNGLRASPVGRLGAGVYFTPDRSVASLIAKHRGLEFIVECEVAIQKTFDFDAGAADLAKSSKDWAAHGYDCATSMHGPWAGVPVPFREYCVSKPEVARVIKVDGFVAAPT
jgi:hypothetical protein